MQKITMAKKIVLNSIILTLLSISIVGMANGQLVIESAVAQDGSPEELGIGPGDFVTITFNQTFSTPTIVTCDAGFFVNPSTYNINTVIEAEGGIHSWRDDDKCIDGGEWSVQGTKQILKIYISSTSVTVEPGDTISLGDPDAAIAFGTAVDTGASVILSGSFNGDQPYLVSISPTDGAVGVSPSTKIVATFSETMTDNPNGAILVQAIRNSQGEELATPETVDGSLKRDSTDLEKIIFTPTGNLDENYTYNIIIVAANAKDDAGNPLLGDKDLESTFSTYMDYKEENVVIGPDGKTKVILGSYAFKDTDGYIEIDLNPSGDEIDDANEEASESDDPFHFPLTDTIREFIAYDSGDHRYRDDFSNDVTIVMPYSDYNDDGFVDDTSPQVREESLKIWRLDEEFGQWIELKDSGVDKKDKTVSGEVSSFDTNHSVYIVMGRAETALDDAYCYPNPFKPNSGLGHTNITFCNLSPSPEPTIKIFTITGRLVKKLSSDSNERDRIRIWDVKNDEGKEVSSGLYIYLMDNGVEKHTGKLVIIR